MSLIRHLDRSAARRGGEKTMCDRYSLSNSKPLWHRACALLCVAALACSMVPAAAFAADETTGTTSLGVSLKYVQLSVDAPADIVFERVEGGDASGYDPSDPSSWGDLKASVPFTNKSEAAVYLAGADVLQTESAKVSNVFNGPTVAAGGTVGSDDHPFLSLRATDGTAAICAQVNPQTDATAMDFSSTWVSSFTIRERASADDGTDASFTLSLDKSSAAVKSELDLDSDDPVVKFCAIAWTFAMVPDLYVQVAGKPVSSTKSATYSDSDKDLYSDYDARSQVLSQYAGKVYNLNQVKQHSKQLAADTTHATELYKLYDALVTSLAPEGDYECRVRYSNDYWRLRIIGLNQDVAANSAEGYVEGATVGLTFQFFSVIDGYLVSGSGDNTGGWEGNGMKALRSGLNAGGKYYDAMGIKDSIVTVKKAYGPTYNSTSTDVSFSSDKMFVLSWYELTGKKDWGMPFTPYEGTGSNHDEQYRFYANKGIVASGNNLRWLARYGWKDYGGTEVKTLGGGNGDTGDQRWWLRSVYPYNDDRHPYEFMYVSSSGNPTSSMGLGVGNMGAVLPCFCV